MTSVRKEKYGKIVGEKENKNVTDRELGLLMAGVV